MKSLFVDTGGWMACVDLADPAHRRACSARDRALEDGLALVTTDFVVDETLTRLRLRLGLPAAETWWRQVDGSARVRWERVTVERFDRARGLFFKYRDKAFSFTDCTSFAVMQELRLTHALTTDKALPADAISRGAGGSEEAGVVSRLLSALSGRYAGGANSRPGTERIQNDIVLLGGMAATPFSGAPERSVVVHAAASPARTSALVRPRVGPIGVALRESPSSARVRQRLPSAPPAGYGLP